MSASVQTATLSKATLYIVATPIGNLGDISLRALDVLKSVDIIAAEDTRHSAKLLQHYHISTPLIPYHDHGDDNQTQRLLEKLRAHKSVALISDAGTPLISDPGFKLVRTVRAEGFAVVPLPGACALIAALCASGLPTDKFSFEGFPPAKSLARRTSFESVSSREHTLIFYESPHRIAESLKDMLDIFGAERKAVLARELSKSFETFLCGTLRDLNEKVALDANQSKGEIVVLVHGASLLKREGDLSEEAQTTMKILLSELSIKQSATLGAKLTGEKKNKLYQWALDQENSDTQND